MRVCIVNPISQTSPDRWTVPPVLSNSQSVAVQLARHIELRGAQCEVIMAGPFTPAVEDEGVNCRYLPVIQSPFAPAAQIPWMPQLVDNVRGGRFDAVISSEIFQWSTYALANSRGIPPLFVWHEADQFQRFGRRVPARIFYATAGRRIASRAAAFLPRTDRAAQFLRDVGVPNAKIGPEIPNGIDSVRFVPSRVDRDRTPLVLYVGSLIERKNPILAVRSMIRLRERHPSARLLLKGFGEQEDVLRAEAVRLGIDDAVILDTRRSDHAEMASIYNRAWVAVFPSFRDFASLSPIEAVACGVPVVLSERLFSAKYLEDARCGLAVGDDERDFGDAIADLIDTHEERGLDDQVLAPVVDRFSISAGADRLVAFLTASLQGENVTAS